ncbi:MAG: hypothetical protein ABI854_07060 [Betaproteobacteria bacterium]
MDKETQELLVWYVNGTLTGPERDRAEAALRSQPGASTWLAWERSVQAAVKDDPLFDVEPERGLYQTMQRIRADAKPKSTAPAAQSSWLSSLRAKFQWSPALALAGGVVAVQFAVIAQMWTAGGEDGEYSGVRALHSRANATDVFIRIAFKPESPAGEVNTLLRELHAEVVSGPSQLGDYYLLVQKRTAQDALSLLQGNANIESAEFVSALPARP